MFRWLVVFLMLIAATTAFAQDATPGPGDITIEVDPAEVENAAGWLVNVTQAVADAVINSVNALLTQVLVVPQNDAVRILMVIGGAVLLFAGWRVYDEIVLLSGVLIGALLGASASAEPLIQIAGLLLGAVIGGALAVLVYYVAVFGVGAFLGLSLVNSAAVTMGYAAVNPILALLGAIIGGVVLVSFSGLLMIILASILGAQLLVLALGLGPTWLWGLALLGVIAQFFLARRTGTDIRRRPRSRMRIGDAA